MHYKRDGFDGQRAIVLPKSVILKFCLFNQVINNAFITDIGYYPKAQYHYRKRLLGADQNILIYCLEGKGIANINSVSYNIGPGDYFVIPNNVPHHYKTDEKNPWTIYWCHFKGAQADAIVQSIFSNGSSYKYSVDFLEDRINLFEQLYFNLEKGYSYENLTYVNILFLQFLSSFMFSDRVSVSLKDKTDDFLDKSICFMQDHLEKNLTLADFARLVNFSSSHYSYIFKHKTGYSPIEYFNHLKIQKACQYLQFTSLRINEIAAKIGISDAYYFSRLFTKTMGFSPRDYRQARAPVK
jgi:AraC-like DNA-binding protein